MKTCSARRHVAVHLGAIALLLAGCGGQLSSADVGAAGRDAAKAATDGPSGADAARDSNTDGGGHPTDASVHADPPAAPADLAHGNTSDAADAGAPGADGSTALVNPAPGSRFFVGANFWNIDWEGQDDFFTSGTDFATTQNPWLPQLLSDLAPYSVLRFMDWNQTNDSNNPQASWDTRKAKTDPQNEPVAFEWQIDLCNRTKKDYWVNVPHEATPDYWTMLAQLIHDQLDPSLRVYLEWSNEVWNGGFPQHAYADAQGQSMSLPGNDHAAAFYVYSAVRVYEAFEAVFGQGSPRLVKVLSGQAAYAGPCMAHMAALADATINPNGTAPDVYAIAPYFGGTSIAELNTALGQVAGWTTSHLSCVAAAGLPVISYEGGSDSYAAGNGCTTLQHDPGMHDLYTSYFDALSGAGMGGPFMQYTHSGSCWGLKEKTTDSLSVSPKYQGVLDWLAAHP